METTMPTLHPPTILRRSINLAVAAMVAVGWLCVPGRAHAQTAVQPTVTVAPFAGVRSDKDANALADELAMRLVETGRFRVLTREWLPLARRDGRPTIDAVRAAAVSAGVQYVVTAETRTSARPLGVGLRPLPMPRAPMPPSGIGPAARQVAMARAARGRADQFVSVIIRI